MNKIKELLKEIINYLLSLLVTKVNKEIDNFQLWGWLIWIGEKETDFLLGGEINIEKQLTWNLPDKPKYFYNQGAQYKTRNWCTVFSAITQLSHLKDYKFSLQEIYQIGDKMIKEGKLDPNNGAYLSDAIDYTRNFWNSKFPNSLISSYQIDYLDTKLNSALQRSNYITQLGYRTSSEIYQDKEADWLADKKIYPKVGWHAVSRFKDRIVDNYDWLVKYNIYSFLYEKDLIKNWVIYQRWYLFLNQR